MATYKITLSASGWTQTTSELWYDTDQPGKVFDDSAATNEVIAITPPQRELYRFKGFRGTVNGTANTLCINADGSFADGMSGLISGTGAKTLTVWYDSNTARKITLNLNGGSDGITVLYRPYTFNAGDPIYSDWLCEHEVTSIAGLFPKKESHTCKGFFNNGSTGTTQYISADGTIDANLRNNNVTTIYAQWERVSWKITLNKQSGAGGTDAIYGGVGGGFWLDDLCTERAETVVPPTRTGYDFAGYWQNTGGGGGRYITADGTVALSQSTVTTDAFTIHAAWVTRDFTLTFDYNGGTGETASKTVTFASAVGTLPSATHPKGDFVGWRVNGSLITSSTVWNIDSDATAVAEWDYYFGRVVDYFGLGSETLVPFESDEGTNRPRVVTRHYGKAAGAEQTGPVWRNPSVKYMVVGDMTLSVTLGKAFAKKTGTINGPYVSNGTWYFGNHSGMTETGYMITEVSIATRRGKFPVVTVSSVANEGADAINKFAVSVPISARARAQNILGGVSGGGELHAATLRAVCDPVVLTEGPAPCASDAVNGRYELHAETLSANGEAAPTASGGFTATGEPATNAGTEYTRYRLTASKEIT